MIDELEKLSGMNKMDFKYEPKIPLLTSYKETNTEPNYPQQNQIKRNGHTIAQSKQLRDQSDQTCDPQCPLPINWIMLNNQQKME